MNPTRTTSRFGFKGRRTAATAIVIAIVGCAALAAPAAGIAAQGKASADPATQQYADSLTGAENSAGGANHGSAGNSGTAAEATSGGNGGGGVAGALPFTGTDLIALASIAICLLATGFLLSVLSRQRS